MDALNRIVSALLGFLMMFVALASAQPAFAECPAWAGTVCNILPGPAPVCVAASGVFACYAASAEEHSKVFVVQNYSDDFSYEAFGEINGDAFCCETSAEITTVSIEGSAQDDTLGFDYYDNTTHAWYSLAPDGEGSITAVIYGGGDMDNIKGSSFGDPDFYTETLNGDAGADVIDGRDGNDIIYGGDDPDVLHGGGGDDEMYGGDDADEMYGDIGRDEMYGGPGGDTMSGGNGDDEMNGEAGVDIMAGGVGDDTMDGGTEADIMCGDAHATNGDTLDDGDTDSGSVDQLWGNSQYLDDLVCGSSTTIWDGHSEETGCTGTEDNVRPEECP